MNNNKIVVDFARVKNILIAEIINIPAPLKGVGTIITNEGYKISSMHYAMIAGKTLYLTGLSDDSTRPMSYDYATDEEAQRAIDMFSGLIREYNETHNEGNESSIWRRAE